MTLDRRQTMDKNTTKELIREAMEEAANKSADIVTSMVKELESSGVVITEDMMQDIVKKFLHAILVALSTKDKDEKHQ